MIRYVRRISNNAILSDDKIVMSFQNNTLYTVPFFHNSTVVTIANNGTDILPRKEKQLIVRCPVVPRITSALSVEITDQHIAVYKSSEPSVPFTAKRIAFYHDKDTAVFHKHEYRSMTLSHFLEQNEVAQIQEIPLGNNDKALLLVTRRGGLFIYYKDHIKKILEDKLVDTVYVTGFLKGLLIWIQKLTVHSPYELLVVRFDDDLKLTSIRFDDARVLLNCRNDSLYVYKQFENGQVERESIDGIQDISFIKNNMYNTYPYIDHFVFTDINTSEVYMLTDDNITHIHIEKNDRAKHEPIMLTAKGKSGLEVIVAYVVQTTPNQGSAIYSVDVQSGKVRCEHKTSHKIVRQKTDAVVAGEVFYLYTYSEKSGYEIEEVLALTKDGVVSINTKDKDARSVLKETADEYFFNPYEYSLHQYYGDMQVGILTGAKRALVLRGTEIDGIIPYSQKGFFLSPEGIWYQSDSKEVQVRNMFSRLVECGDIYYL